MQTYTANEAKTRFGEFLDRVQREPVRVMRHDRVVGVMVSAEDYEAMRRFYADRLRQTLNEAETRAEHIDPALKAAGWGVVEGSRIRREYPITLGRLEGAGQRGKPPDGRLCTGIPQHQAGGAGGQGLGQAADRRRRPGQGLRRQAGYSLHLRHQRARHLRHRHADRPEGEQSACFPTPDELWNRTFATRERLARPLRRRAVRGQGRLLPGALLPGHRHRAVLDAIADGRRTHPAHPGDRHRQDLHRLPDRLEAVP
jgi:prevent-host-death family protein